jgi:cytochrome P450
MQALQSLVFGFAIFLIAVYASFWWSRRRLYYLAAKLPGPRGLPFLGVAYLLINKSFTEIFNLITTITNGYGSPGAVWLGPELMVFADTPESLQIVLNSQKCLDKSPLYDVLVLTKGLLVGSGELWRRHRKILNPSFSIGILQQLIPTFDDKSKIFVKNLEKEVGNEPFDVYGYMSACSLETLLKGTMEIDRDVQSKPFESEYIHHIEVLVFNEIQNN